MEKCLLTLFAAFLLTTCTNLKIVSSFGIASFVHQCIDALLWLIQKSYLNKEKDPSHPDKIKQGSYPYIFVRKNHHLS